MTKRDTFIGEILVDRNLLSFDQLSALLEERADKGGTLSDLLISKEIMEEKQLLEAISHEMDFPFEEKIKADDVDTELVSEIPISFAKANSVLPLSETPDGIAVACANPFDLGALDAVQATRSLSAIPRFSASRGFIRATR